MNNILGNLKPSNLWKNFELLCSVPHPSGKEERIREAIIDFAKKLNLETYVDEIGNLIIRKPATKGMENHRGLVLQSHLDMVCEKNASKVHDFFKDSIIPVVDGEWVRAEGTTLGADCGIGIATSMAILASKEIKHGPLECLFTVDEETGLTGAKALEPGFFSGKALINLDSEDEGELFIGCAGGIDTVGSFHFDSVPVPAGLFAIRISVCGLLGGHSGDDINKNRGNAIKVLNRFIWQTRQKYEIQFSDFNGGNLRNAIAREAYAIILVPSSKKEEVTIDFNIFRAQIEEEMLPDEPQITLELESADSPESVMEPDSRDKLINAIYALPHGVLKMSTRMPGMVETSTNLASVKIVGDNLVEITTSQRSDMKSCKMDAAYLNQSVFKLINAKVKQGDGYPGWTPDPKSELLKITAASYSKLFNVKPIVRSIHAGLECGLFLEKFPGLDMISFGPTLRGVHSPDERIDIKTVGKFWALLLDVLENY